MAEHGFSPPVSPRTSPLRVIDQKDADGYIYVVKHPTIFKLRHEYVNGMTQTDDICFVKIGKSSTRICESE